MTITSTTARSPGEGRPRSRQHWPGLDVVPGAEAEEGELGRADSWFERLARDVEQLAGDADPKLAAATALVRDLIRQDHNPILFCRFIPTAEYVAEHLRGRLGRGVEVAGWAFSQGSPVSGVELARDGEVIARTPLNALRPDLAEGYTQFAGIERAGFRIEAPMPPVATVAIEVRAVLHDDTRAPLGVLTLPKAA